MHPIKPLVLLLAILFLGLLGPAGPGASQERSPELQRLEYFVGDWTYGDPESPGTMHFEWFGSSFLRGREISPRGTEYLHVWGYDEEEGAYTGCRYATNGYSDCFTGWFHEDRMIWFFGGSLNPLRRITFIFESPAAYTFRWARSVEGGDWETTSEGRSVRVR